MATQRGLVLCSCVSAIKLLCKMLSQLIRVMASTAKENPPYLKKKRVFLHVSGWVWWSSLGAPGQLHHYLNQVHWGETLRPFFSKHNQTNIHHSQRPFFFPPPWCLHLSYQFVSFLTHSGDVLMTHLRVMPGKHLTQRWLGCRCVRQQQWRQQKPQRSCVSGWQTDSTDDSPLLLCSRMMSH